MGCTTCTSSAASGLGLPMNFWRIQFSTEALLISECAPSSLLANFLTDGTVHHQCACSVNQSKSKVSADSSDHQPAGLAKLRFVLSVTVKSVYLSIHIAFMLPQESAKLQGRRHRRPPPGARPDADLRARSATAQLCTVPFSCSKPGSSRG